MFFCMLNHQTNLYDFFMRVKFYLTLFCEVIHKPINFQITIDSGCATSSPMKRGPEDLLGAGV